MSTSARHGRACLSAAFASQRAAGTRDHDRSAADPRARALESPGPAPREVRPSHCGAVDSPRDASPRRAPRSNPQQRERAVPPARPGPRRRDAGTAADRRRQGGRLPRGAAEHG